MQLGVSATSAIRMDVGSLGKGSRKGGKGCYVRGGGRILHENARRLAARATTKVAKVKGGHGPSLNQLPPYRVACSMYKQWKD